jgi:hypothetical protein
MLRVSAALHDLRFLQTTHLLSLIVLLLVLSVPTLFTLVEHSKLEKIEFGATIHASFTELEPIDIAAPSDHCSRATSIPQVRHLYLVAHQSQRTEMLRDDWLPPLPARHQAVLLCARAPYAETFPPVGKLPQRVEEPASTVEGSPVLLPSNPLACGKRERRACCAERVKSGWGWMEEAACLVADAEPRLRGDHPDGSNVSR